MKLALIHGLGELSKRDFEMIDKILTRYRIGYRIFSEGELEYLEKDLNLIIVIGGDRVLIKSLLILSDFGTPILSLYGRRSKGFLYVAGIDSFSEVLHEVIIGNYIIEDRTRIATEFNNKMLAPALNEVAIFSKLSGRLIRYSLFINGEFIWRDDADGVIISTPTGSTAYALSAGGSIIKNADVFEIVPVNSLIPTHKPMVTSSKNEILVSDLAPNENVLVIDGQIRVVIESETVKFYKAKFNARFIRLKKNSIFNIDKRLVRRIIPGVKHENVIQLPPSAKLVYKVLEYEGPLTYREILEKSGLPSRTVRYALKTLIDKRIIIKSSLERDARKSIYEINIESSFRK